MGKKRFIFGAIILSMFTAALYFYDFFFMQGPYGVSNSDVLIQIGYMEHWYSEGELPMMCQAYPLYYYVLRIMYHFVRNWQIVVLALCAVWSFITNMVQISLVRRMCDDGYNLYSLLAGTALSFAWPISFQYSFFGGQTYWEMPLEQVFLTSGATSPNHSMTYLFLKPFAILALYLFLKILDADDNRYATGYAVLFGITLFFSVLAKPCFYQAFAPAGVIYVLIYLIRKGWKSFIRCCIVAVAYLPATAWVLYAMRLKLAPYRFSFAEGINMFNDGTPLPLLLSRAIVFCLFVGLCMIRYKAWNNKYILGLMVYAFGALEFLCLIETENPEWLSMSWGYFTGQYAFFILSIVIFYRLVHRRGDKLTKAVSIFGNSTLAVHAAFGIAVFSLTYLPWWINYLSTIHLPFHEL
ncbi:MAG: hypothetical protein K5673_08325 [Lachnospiraceae bacterium]|nr:hypothetical protein [Lachnospiraceae bacterium]